MKNPEAKHISLGVADQQATKPAGDQEQEPAERTPHNMTTMGSFSARPLADVRV